MMATKPHECKHGHLARKCLTCDLEQELDQLRADLERVTRERDDWRRDYERVAMALGRAVISTQGVVHVAHPQTVMNAIHNLQRDAANARADLAEAERLLERLAPLCVRRSRWLRNPYPDEAGPEPADCGACTICEASAFLARRKATP